MMAALAAAAAGSGVLEACSPTPTPVAPTGAPNSSAAPTTAAPAAVAPAPTAAAKPQAAAATRPMVFIQRIEPITLDPHANDFGYSQFPQRASYESLTNYEMTPDGQSKLVPMLAASWKMADDATSATIELQKGVKFSDGTPFDAQAVKWNFDRIFGLKLGPQGRLPAFDKIEVLGETSLRITLKSPFAPLMDTLAKPLMISPTAASKNEVSGDQGQKWFFDHMVGTGPFILGGFVKGQQLTYSRNPNYWRGWSGNHLDKLVIKLVKEPATQRMMLETGDADLADGIAFDDLDALSKGQGVVVHADPTLQLVHLMMRMKGPLKDKRIRQALQYAFDYDAFIKGVFNGRARVPHGPLPFGVWAFDSTLPESKRDVAKAKQLLSDAGFPNGGFSLSLWILPPFGWFQPREAQILQQNLKELGITLNIEEKTDAAILTKALQQIDSGPDMYAWTYNNSLNDPDDNFRRMYHSTLPFPKGTNGDFYNNPQVDQLIDQGVAIGSQEKRLPIYQELQKILLDDAPAIFVAQPDFFTTRRDVLQDYPYHPFVPNNGPDWWKMWLSK